MSNKKKYFVDDLIGLMRFQDFTGVSLDKILESDTNYFRGKAIIKYGKFDDRSDHEGYWPNYTKEIYYKGDLYYVRISIDDDNKFHFGADGEYFIWEGGDFDLIDLINNFLKDLESFNGNIGNSIEQAP